jgi:hypothetical protein
MVYLRTVFALIACQEASLFGGHLVLVSIRFPTAPEKCCTLDDFFLSHKNASLSRKTSLKRDTESPELRNGSFTPPPVNRNIILCSFS